MQPHKPSPPSRKVEVDLSEILIRPQELERFRAARYVVPFPAGTKDPSVGERPSGIGTAGRVNIIFTVGASLVAVFYTLSLVDDLEHLRRNSARVGNAISAGVELSTISLPHRSWRKHRPVSAERFTPLTDQLVATLLSRSPNLTSPSLATPNPLNISAFPQIGDRLANVGSTSSSRPMQSGGPSAPTGSSPKPSSSGGNVSGKPRTVTRPMRMKNLSRPLRKSSSERQISQNRSTNGSRALRQTKSAPVGDGIHRAGGSMAPSGVHHGLNRSMQSTGGLGGAALNREIGNAMQMQHGMVAQPALGAGGGGLNGAGLGGTTGNAHAARAHR